MGPNNGYGYMPGNQQFSQYPSQPQQPQPSFQNFANQQYTQNRQSQNMLICKFVEDPSKIMPIDVPSTGEPAFFVDKNFQYIIAKAVNNRGTIDDVIYEPVKRQSPEQVQEAKFQELKDTMNKRFESLENMLTAFLTQPDNKDGGKK